MIICSSSNIDLIQGVSGYGTVSDGATDWRIENTATGVFNILNSPNLLTPNVSIIGAGNIGIGTIPVSGTNKLQVQGNLNVSGGYFVAGVAFKPATAVLADTATALATSRNIAGVGFTGASAIDIPYFNLTNKITAGNGISLTAGSASSSPSISTNLTAGSGISISAAASPVISANISAGSGIVFTPTGNNISISSGASSQWTGNVGANIYYNSGNVGIGTATPQSSYKLQVQGNAWVNDQLVFSDTYKGGGGTDYACNKISLWGSGNTPTTTSYFGFGVAAALEVLDYYSYSHHAFYTGTRGGTNYGTERLRITSGGNVGIGTASIQSSYKLQVQGNSWVENQLVFNNSYSGGTGGANYACNKIHLYGGGNAPTTNTDGVHGFGISANGSEYFSNNNHLFFTNSKGGTVYGDERLRITSGGNVGIGTATPGFRLEVSGTTNAGSFNAFYMGSGGTGTFGGPWSNVCAKFNLDVWSTGTIFVSSDIRIKEDIQDIIDDTALQSILSIEPKTYKYVDKLVRGDKKVFGFIAQQIREVIPEAITIEKSYIPNIYLVADYIDSVITLSSQPTKVIIKMNDKIKCYDKDNKDILVEVIEVIDDLTFRIKEIEYTDTKIFVYGTFVDDFHTLNKDYIFTLNVCATQELHRRIEAQSVLLKSQDDRIKDLEAKVATLMSSM